MGAFTGYFCTWNAWVEKKDTKKLTAAKAFFPRNNCFREINVWAYVVQIC